MNAAAPHQPAQQERRRPAFSALNDGQHWVMDKRIPITAVIMFVAYLVTFIWTIAQQHFQNQQNQTQIAAMEIRMQDFEKKLEFITTQNSQTSSTLLERMGRMEERSTQTLDAVKEIKQDVKDLRAHK